jgi:acetylornithine/N-succinyldiaminopimelate aminotransferase
LISIAKGMGNGFPIGGLLIHPDIKPWSGMLGTTFGGNYLACAAGLSVLEVIEQEDLMANAAKLGQFWMEQLQSFSDIKAIRGKGLMIGFDLPDELASLRKDLLFKQSIFTGEAKPNTVRLLPSLALSKSEADLFLEALSTELKQTVSS